MKRKPRARLWTADEELFAIAQRELSAGPVQEKSVMLDEAPAGFHVAFGG